MKPSHLWIEAVTLSRIAAEIIEALDQPSTDFVDIRELSLQSREAADRLATLAKNLAT